MRSRLIAILAMIVGCLGVVSSPVMAAVSCPEGTPRHGDSSVKSLGECSIPKDEASRYDLMNKVTVVINVIVGVVGIVSVAMIVLGGISYATSQGDAAKAKKAQNTIIYSVVGLLISLLAFAIVNFVLTSVF